jgi:hypothetical protein
MDRMHLIFTFPIQGETIFGLAASEMKDVVQRNSHRLIIFRKQGQKWPCFNFRIFG